jgi:hypothetical protein
MAKKKQNIIYETVRIQSGPKPKRKRRQRNRNRRRREKACAEDIGFLNTPSPESAAVSHAVAQLRPWDVEPCGSAFSPALRSQKIKTITRANVAIGTNGYGFVFVNANATNDSPSFYYTDATFAGSTLAITGTGIYGALSNSPYGYAQFTTGYAGLSFRVVGCALRLRWNGKRTDCNGRVDLLEDPAHQDLTGESLLLIQNMNSTVRQQAVPGKWHIVQWHPRRDGEKLYVQVPAVIDKSMCAVLQGVAGSVFEAELIQIIEIGGQTVTAVATQSVAHDVGANKLTNTLQSLPVRTKSTLQEMTTPKVRRVLQKAHRSPDPIRSIESDIGGFGKALQPFAKDFAIASKGAPVVF